MTVPFLAAMAERGPKHLARLPGADLPWLADARQAALSAALSLGLPGRREETWRQTPLRAWQQREFQLDDAKAVERAVDTSRLAAAIGDDQALVFFNGVFRADLSRLDALPEGVVLESFAAALARDPEPLRFAFGGKPSSPEDAFMALNLAFASDGMVLRVAPGCQVQEPLHLVQIGSQSEQPVAWHGRNLVDVGERASVVLVEHHLADDAHENLMTQVTDLSIRSGAKCQLLQFQDASVASALVRRTKVHLADGATLRSHALELGGALSRHEMVVSLRGAGADYLGRGVFLPRGRQHIDNQLAVEHQVGNTSSDVLWRGVADQRGHGVFRGAITVATGADGSAAELSNKNLLLSRSAVIDTQPILEIHADEVVAAHGATVGQLDPGSLFYLRSRGIPLDEARALLVEAFGQVAIADMADDRLREHALGLLAAHAPAAGSVADSAA